MLILKQGKLIKLLRAELAEATGQLQRVVIASVRIDEPVPAALFDSLTTAERRILSRWLAAYHDNQKQKLARVVLEGAPPRLDKLIEALDVTADTLQPNEADRLWHQVQAIAQTLKRTGYPCATSEQPTVPPLSKQLNVVNELESTSDTPESPVSSSNDMSGPSRQ
ncbi:hypothetical protein [Burkholderia alba]|uniref:hypothetical protein n=1 Tax=Burkholderia alba TaxID=2683677 RepID=UPI002B05F29C|nr:hypothetical protein [Burkholderia alba]